MWLTAALTAYFLFALVTLTDKYLLRDKIPDPKVFSFWVGIISIFTLIFAPLGFQIPGFSQIIFTLLTGAIFILALFSLYSALKISEASRVGTTVGGLTPIFLFAIAYLLFGKESLPNYFQLIAFLLLFSGGFIISIEKFTVSKFLNSDTAERGSGKLGVSPCRKTGRSEATTARNRGCLENIVCEPKASSYVRFRHYPLRVFIISAFSALFFALYFNFAKIVFSGQPFISGLIWIKLGGFFAALFFLMFRDVRKSIFERKRGIIQKKIGAIFISKQAIGGIAGILQNLAISLAKLNEVILVNTLQGAQYGFLLIFALILTKKFPQILKEDFRRFVFLQKIFGIILISVGIFLLAFHEF